MHQGTKRQFKYFFFHLQRSQSTLCAIQNGNSTNAAVISDPQTSDVQPTYPSQVKRIKQEASVKKETGPNENGKQASDRNIGSILIPDEGDKITKMYCSFCGLGIEMTDELLTDLIVSQNKQVMELLRKRINQHFAEAKSHQKEAHIQCELIGKPIEWNEPTE